MLLEAEYLQKSLETREWVGSFFPETLFLQCLSVPELLGGKQLSATVIDLSPWVEYEFRVLATNSIGTGEPSRPSKKARTKETRTCQKFLCQGQLKNFSLVQNETRTFFKVK